MLTADRIKLLLAVMVAASGIVGYYYFGDKSLLLRVVGILAGFGIASVIALRTAPGVAAWQFAKEARAELRKVVWPTRKETMQMTGIVFALVIVMALFLWGVDWVLTTIVKFFTSRGA